jgi:hypothetical protein
MGSFPRSNEVGALIHPPSIARAKRVHVTIIRDGLMVHDFRLSLNYQAPEVSKFLSYEYDFGLTVR